MALTRTDENELLTALHAGLFETPRWSLFLRRLIARTDAEHGCIHLRPAGSGEAPWRLAGQVTARGIDGHDSGSTALPDATALGGMRPGRVYGGGEMGLDDDRHARFLRITPADGAEAILSVHRRTGDFSARDSLLISTLAPHLAVALATLDQIERLDRDNRAAQAVTAALATAWLMIDARGRIIAADAAARAHLDRGAAMRRGNDGRLRLPMPEAESLLESVLAHPAALHDAPRAAWADYDPPAQLLFLPPPQQGDAPLPPAACLIVMRMIEPGTPLPLQPMIDLFSLTRSEAALAARLAGGDSIAEAADTLHLTLETARNYSKRLFNKTGLRGQPDVVRVLLNGVTGMG